jgi:hypothetical protein
VCRWLFGFIGLCHNPTNPKTADAGDFGKNGLYTSILLKYIKQPLRIEDLFSKVRIEMFKKGGQEPMEYSKLTKPFYFNPN